MADMLSFAEIVVPDKGDISEAEEDTNAVVLKTLLEFKIIDRLFSRPDGSPTLFFKLLVIVMFMYAPYECAVKPEHFADNAGMSEPNTLLYMTFSIFAMGTLTMILAVDAARRVSHAEGELALLGFGVAQVSERTARSLKIWRALLSTAACTSLLFGLFKLMLDFVQWASAGFESGMTMCDRHPLSYCLLWMSTIVELLSHLPIVTTQQ